MNKTILVMKNELLIVFKRPVFLILAFGIPIVITLIMGGVKILRSESVDSTSSETQSQTPDQLATEGYIDHSGIIQIIPKDFEGILISYASENQAKEALENGEISAFYIIPQDYIEVGKVEYVYPDGKSFRSGGQQWVISWILNLNLLDGDAELADLIWNPIWHLERKNISTNEEALNELLEDCSRPGASCESNEFIRLIPSIMVVFFFFAIMTSSSMLFQSVGEEKENRTIELLLTSINTRQLLAGKILGLGAAGLVQTIFWLVSIYISVNFNGTVISLPEGFAFPIEIIFWGVIFFVLGYGLYASLMAGAGALVNKMKEAGVASFIAMAPLFFGYVFGVISPFSGSVESGLMIFMSMFPFTSPIVMIMRLTNGYVPFWQLGLASLLLLVTSYLVLILVSNMFNARNLLSGTQFSAKRYIKALFGLPN